MKLPPIGGRSLRGRAGLVAGAAGALLCVLGWYGVSGERFAERQIPYLASATIPGAALIVAGAVLLARPDEEAERERAAGDEETRRQLRLLYDLLVEEAGRTGPGSGHASGSGSATGSTPTGTEAGPGRLWYLPNGRTYHRSGCLLVEGRGDALPVTPAGAGERGLRPCPLCSPGGAAGPPAGRAPTGQPRTGQPPTGQPPTGQPPTAPGA